MSRMQFRMRFFLIVVSGSSLHEFKIFHAKNKITVSIKKSKGDPEITKKSFSVLFIIWNILGCPLHNTLNAGWLRLSFGLSVLGGPLRGYFGSNTVILFSYILFDILYVYLE